MLEVVNIPGVTMQGGMFTDNVLASYSPPYLQPPVISALRKVV